MPGSMRKVAGGYRVTWGGKATARRTTKAKAKAQLRLLRGVEHGMKPRPRKKRRR
jgi:hypothetical protein